MMNCVEAVVVIVAIIATIYLTPIVFGTIIGTCLLILEKIGERKKRHENV